MRLRKILEIWLGSDHKNPSRTAKEKPSIPYVSEKKKATPENVESTKTSNCTGFDDGCMALIRKKKQNDEKLVAGSIAITGLDAIKNSLGTRWEAERDKLLDLAQDTIQKRLGKFGFMQPQGDGSFAICFDSPCQRDAEIKAGLISQDVTRAMNQSVPFISSQLGVRKYISDIPLDDLGDDVHAFPQRLEGIIQQIRADTDEEDLGYRKFFIRKLKIFYAPVWCPKTKLIVSNRAVADMTAGIFETLSVSDCLRTPSRCRT
jgi:hypothetical protein